jgi:hypothetical protein
VQPIHVDPPAEFLSDKVPLVLVAAPTTDLDVGEDITTAARFRNAVIAARRSLIVPTVEVAHGDAAIARLSKRLVLRRLCLARAFSLIWLSSQRLLVMEGL